MVKYLAYQILPSPELYNNAQKNLVKFSFKSVQILYHRVLPMALQSKLDNGILDTCFLLMSMRGLNFHIFLAIVSFQNFCPVLRS